MQFELRAITEPGRRLVCLAEELAADFATRADQHDRDGSYPFENIEALKARGYFAAPVPRECGGLGVESVHDLLVASSRLARGDASVTIGLNMHVVIMSSITRYWRMARAGGHRTRELALAGAMERLVASGAVITSAVSEPNQNLMRPRTTATRNGAGWIVNGTKIFGTMSPAATLLSVGLVYAADSGDERYGFAMIPTDTPGVIRNDDWDALGMRSSGSGSITLRDVHIPADALSDAYAAGAWSTSFLDRFLTSGAAHASASLGIAEAAIQDALAAVAGRMPGREGRRLSERPVVQVLAAENAVDLAAMRATFARACTMIDDYIDVHVSGPATLDEAQAIFKEVQAAKTFVHGAAIRVVDRALSMSGGGAFMNKNRLSRLYRDVRAGPFMHPLADNVVHEYIGQVTLGLEPNIS